MTINRATPTLLIGIHITPKLTIPARLRTLTIYAPH